MSAQIPPQAQRPYQPRQRGSKPLIIIFGTLFGGVALLLIIGTIINATHGSGPAPATYRVTHSQQVTNPATLLVTGTVTNTGKSTGTPSCDITASDPGGAYTGFDTITAKHPLRPGGQLFYSDSIIITGQGARFVTSVKVSCHS